jgi:tRNA dimethylallyltransferase
MMEAGFVDEVARLRARADLNAGLPSMRCVGYRQLWEWLDAGGRTGAALDRAIESGIAASRQLAKRQLTWLRSMPDRLTIDCCVDDAGKQATTALHRAFNH